MNDGIMHSDGILIGHLITHTRTLAVNQITTLYNRAEQKTHLEHPRPCCYSCLAFPSFLVPPARYTISFGILFSFTWKAAGSVPYKCSSNYIP